MFPMQQKGGCAVNGWRMCFFILLGLNALHDLRKREILLTPTLIYCFILLWRCLLSETSGETLLMDCGPGILLLGLSIGTKGKVGVGDCWILLASGLELGLYAAIVVLWSAVMLITAVSVGFLLSGKTNRTEKQELPMVPFLFAAALSWQLFCG
ncbi:MAG: hypothetical protein Q4B03_02855 [Lachnospiraceae bacterium]|nr:hypothetical protein [Lachnospiraceae bacterium]